MTYALTAMQTGVGMIDRGSTASGDGLAATLMHALGSFVEGGSRADGGGVGRIPSIAGYMGVMPRRRRGLAAIPTPGLRTSRAYFGLGDATGAAVGTAVLGPGVGTVVGSILPVAKLFTKSDAGPNQQAATQALQLALAGNLTAVKAIYKRATYIQTQSSAQPWRDALTTIRAQHPEYLDLAGDNKPAGVPEEWIVGVSPAQVVPRIQQYAVYVPGAGPTAVLPPAAQPDLIGSALTALLNTPQGQQLVAQYGPQVAAQMLQQGQAGVGTFVGKNLPLVLGALALGFVLVRPARRGRR